jgi:hypothetical protein
VKYTYKLEGETSSRTFTFQVSMHQGLHMERAPVCICCRQPVERLNRVYSALVLVAPGSGAKIAKLVFACHRCCCCLWQMPRCEFPFRLGVVSDPGQTANSSLILDRMVEEQPEMVSMIGDYAYAGKCMFLC